MRRTNNARRGLGIRGQLMWFLCFICLFLLGLFWLLSTQLLARGEKHLLDRSRVYFRLLKKIVRQGAERGEFRPGLAQEEIVRAFAMGERAQLYGWCLCGGDYSLVAYAEKMTPLFLESFRVGE